MIKCNDKMLSFVIYDSKVIIFGGWIKQQSNIITINLLI